MTSEQLGVAKGALPALVVTLLTLSTAAYLVGKGTNFQLELPTALGLVSLPLLYCIARIANKRYFNESVIRGAAYDTPGSLLAIDKALLQNTLEQTVLAFGTYFILTSILPEMSIALLPVMASLFIVGRIFFIAGYKHGARGRAFGFGLTFYPTALTLIGSIVASFII